MPAPLSNIRVLDLSRVLAGPSCTQLLGDLGCDVIKVERPEKGDDTRGWGPPFLKGQDGEDTPESAYFLSCNRNKRSITINLADPDGQALVRELAGQSDILIENYKVGDMARYGLAYADLKDLYPQLIYCSISGFGQTGPYASLAGYDVMVQAMGGIMSITGEPDGQPMKVGVAIADVMCGMYAAVAILAALHHREKGGAGQYIDLGLFDTQASWLINAGLNYLTSGQEPKRYGNAHPNIVPYSAMPCKDGYFILGVGNDNQFRKFCEFAGAPELADDDRFATNRLRVRNREDLYAILETLTRQKTQEEWVKGLGALGVPCGPVNTIPQVFADPQILARGMKIAIPHPLASRGQVDLIGNPIHFSKTPVAYDRPPPRLGEHTENVLQALLGLSADRIRDLRKKGTI